MEHYTIVESQYLNKYDGNPGPGQSLEDKVNEYVKDGWTPVGEISTIVKEGGYKYYVQAVYRR